MISGTASGNSVTSGITQGGELGHCATDFERTGPLQVLGFQNNLTAAAL
jgi:hypothetical protein